MREGGRGRGRGVFNKYVKVKMCFCCFFFVVCLEEKSFVFVSVFFFVQK